MSPLTLRIADEDLKQKLKEEAKKHGRSMTEEARIILTKALLSSHAPPKYDSSAELYDAIRAIVEPLGGIDELELPPRNSGCIETCRSKEPND